MPYLYHRIIAPDGRRFRDGLHYQHNLAALRQAIDAQDNAIWDENIYMGWLSLLRELSTPTTGHEYPEAMRTRAWATRTLNTQLASWTQLRHDTILYVKQSNTVGITCFYPAGFVEPRLSFWKRFEEVAQHMADLLESIDISDRNHSERRMGSESSPSLKRTVSFRDVQKRHVTFFRNFAEKLAVLKELTRKELACEEFSDSDIHFIRKMVEIIEHFSGSPTYSGWYFSLFYKGAKDATKWDAIVADVHTDSLDEVVGDPGYVLHQGVGNVNLMVIAVDNESDRMIYAGPVLSHYEFEMPGLTRKSDSEWRQALQTQPLPTRPGWARSYLVPKK